MSTRAGQAARSVTIALLNERRFFAAAKWYFSRKIGRHVSEYVLIGDQKILLRSQSHDYYVAKSCLFGEFDELIDMAPDIDDGLIIDAGGYIGTAAIVFARRYPQATIITLEPSEENLRILKKNVACYPNIIVLNKALGAEPGSIQLRNRGTGQWGFTVVDRPDDSPDAKQMHEVEVTTVNDILLMVGRSEVDIIKIDIEGGEHALFSGKTEWIDKTRIVCAELHDRIIAGCTEKFELATKNRKNWQMAGEKVISVSRHMMTEPKPEFETQ